MRGLTCARLIAVTAMLALIAPSAQAEMQKIKMTVTSRTGPAAPYFIAIDKGYFAEQGLECEIVDAGGGVAIPALISGSVDFSMSAAVSVGAILRGAALRVIYTMADRPPYQLWVTQPEIKTLADLKGKQVGIISRGDTFEIAMRITLRDAGLPMDLVGYTALGAGTVPRQAALASGSLPAIILTTGDVEPLRDSPGFAKARMLVDMERDIRMPYTGVATSAKHLEGDAALVKRFLRAMVRAMAYMRAYKQQTIEILAKADPQTDKRVFEAQYDDLIPTLTADGTAPEALIRKDLEIRAVLLDLPVSSLPPSDKIFDYRPLAAVNAELVASGWKPAP